MPDDLSSEALDGAMRAAFEVGPEDSVLARIRRLGARPRVLLADGGDEGHRVVRAPGPGRNSEVVDDERYQVVGEIGRGAIGIVYKGRDRDLGRDVAMKVLRPEHVEVPELFDRFIEEAQIGAQLQHPGIVPVYGIGLQPDGRPFFTMGLVKGGTLAALLRQRGEPGHDRRRFLQIFEQACQTVAYAHSRGVVHRDLKPSNVMVGPFGEVQVVDWGFGTLLAPETAAPAGPAGDVSVIATVRSRSARGSGGATGSGGGAPAYLPPEQAAGLVTEIDRRSDVWSLGAILCELLTGRPPYTGDGADALALAVEARLEGAYARLDRCGAEPELVELARRCLAPRRADRPVDAGEVARAIAAHLAAAEERAHAAEVKAIEEKARLGCERKDAQWAEAAKRRTRVVAVCVVAAAAAGTAAWVVDDAARNARLERARPEVEAALEEAALAKAKGKFSEALGRARKAHDLAEAKEVGEELHARADGMVAEVERAAGEAEAARRRRDEDAAFVRQLEEILLERADHVDSVRTDRALAAAFAARGVDFALLDPTEALHRLRERHGGAAVELASILDQWAWLRHMKALEGFEWTRLLAITRDLDPDPWRNRLRDAACREDLDGLKRLATEALTQALPPTTLDLVGWLLMEPAKADAEAIYRQAQQLHPGGFWINLRAGLAAKSADEAVAYASAAVALRPSSSAAHTNLGLALSKKGLCEEAVAESREAVRLSPGNMGARTNLGSFLKQAGRVDEAIVVLREAVRMDPSFSIAHLNLAVALWEKGARDDAIAEVRAAIRTSPGNPVAHSNLGGYLQEKGRLDEAIAECREAVRLDLQYAGARMNLGSVLSQKGLLDEAIPALREAVRLDPQLARARAALGWALEGKGLLEEAITEYREAVRLDPRDAKAHHGLGRVLGRSGSVEEGIAELRQAIALDPDLAIAHGNLGHLLRDKGLWSEAVVAYQAQVRLDPKNAEAHAGLGGTLSDAGRHEEALPVLEQARALDPKHATTHLNLGVTLVKLHRVDEGIVELRESIRLSPEYALAHANLGWASGQKGRVDEAVAELREAVRLDPKSVSHRSNLGDALTAKGLVDEAIATLRDAIRLQPRFAAAHHNLGVALASKGLLEESVTATREAVRLEPSNATSHRNLALGLRGIGKLDEALGELREAVRLAPRDLGSLLTLSVVLCEKGLFEEALQVAENSVRVFPRNVRAANQRALCLMRLRRHDEARRGIDEALAAAKAPGDRLLLLYNAACLATLASVAPPPEGQTADPAEPVRLRREALARLREALPLALAARPAAHVGSVDDLGLWLTDPDLASVREEAELDTLPSDERAEWKAFWKPVREAVAHGTEGR